MSTFNCPTPETYGPGENCGATVLPAYAPDLATTGFHLAWFLVVILGVLLVGALLLWLQARLRPVQAEADVAALTVKLAAANDQNAYLELMLDAAAEINVEYAVEFPGGTAFVSDDRDDVEDWVQWIVGGSLVRRTVARSDWSPVGDEDES